LGRASECENGTATDEVIMEQVKYWDNSYAFSCKNVSEFYSKKSDYKIVLSQKLLYILHNIARSSALKVLTKIFCTPYDT
jgi:hypothetical protein